MCLSTLFALIIYIIIFHPEVIVLKIGEFTDSFIPIIDGVGRVVLAYCEHLGKRDNEVYAIAPMADTGYRGRYNFELIDFLSTGLPGGLQWREGIPGADPHYTARMKNVDLDIVHSHSPFISGYAAMRYAYRHKVPMVSTFHSKYYDDFYKVTQSKAVSELGVKAVLEYYDHCDEVWAVSSSTADVLRDYGYKGSIFVVENGSDILPKESQGDPAEAKERFGLTDDPVLLFVGQMNWKKNILLILEAVSKLVNNGEKLQLMLVGQGPNSEEISRKVDELGISDITKIPGHITSVKDLDGIYRAADVFVFPSLYDNAPMVVREAARAFTPPVLARGSSSAEIVEDGVNGRLCEDDPDDLARVIHEMLSDRDALLAMGKKASETIPIPWDGIIDRVEERYRYLIENHDPAPSRLEEIKAYLKRLNPVDILLSDDQK